MFRLIGKILFFFIRFIIHLPFAVFHGLRRFFFGVNFDKMNGYEFEEYAARYLKRNGYSKITVTKASRDFGVDLIAKKHRTTYAVQCKSRLHFPVLQYPSLPPSDLRHPALQLHLYLYY